MSERRGEPGSLRELLGEPPPEPWTREFEDIFGERIGAAAVAYNGHPQVGVARGVMLRSGEEYGGGVLAVLSPAEARRFARRILRQADAAEYGLVLLSGQSCEDRPRDRRK